MITVGITGGSGSGKSTVGRIFASLGALLLDADAIYHSLLEESEAMRDELRIRFGDEIFSEGRVSRPLLRRIAFADPEALSDLNTITHRYVLAEIVEKLKDRKEGLAVVDAILLFESGLNGLCDVTVGVLAPTAVRVSRIMARDGLSEEEAKARIAAQKADAYYRERCDIILTNDKTPAALEQDAVALYENLAKSG